MAHYNCVKWEIFENMQRGSVVGAIVRFFDHDLRSAYTV